MSDIHITRDHALGRDRARQVAIKWAQHAQKKHDITWQVVEGAEADTVEFARSGFKGQMRVTANRMEVSAQLNFLLKAFTGQIREEATKQLDAALAKEAARKA